MSKLQVGFAMAESGMMTRKGLFGGRDRRWSGRSCKIDRLENHKKTLKTCIRTFRRPISSAKIPLSPQKHNLIETRQSFWSSPREVIVIEPLPLAKVLFAVRDRRQCVQRCRRFRGPLSHVPFRGGGLRGLLGKHREH